MQSFQALCSMLADTTYWNILDIRMMEAMVTASLIPAAQVVIENFKKTFYRMHDSKGGSSLLSSCASETRVYYNA